MCYYRTDEHLVSIADNLAAANGTQDAFMVHRGPQNLDLVFGAYSSEWARGCRWGTEDRSEVDLGEFDYYLSEAHFCPQWEELDLDDDALFPMDGEVQFVFVNGTLPCKKYTEAAPMNTGYKNIQGEQTYPDSESWDV